MTGFAAFWDGWTTVSDVVLLLFNFDQNVQSGVEFGHFGVVFAHDSDGFVLTFLKDSEVGDGEIGDWFFGVGGDVVFHNGQ